MRDSSCVDTESAVHLSAVLGLLHTVQIIQAIQDDEQTLQRCSMEPAMLPVLVEHNTAIAIEVWHCLRTVCMHPVLHDLSGVWH